MLLQRRYEFSILFPNYFITVVYYCRTHPILFLYFFSIATFFTFLIFFHYWFLLFLYGIYNFISDSMFYFYLQCTSRYSLDSTMAGSKVTLIICSVDYVMQTINLNIDARSEALTYSIALLLCLILFMRIT